MAISGSIAACLQSNSIVSVFAATSLFARAAAAENPTTAQLQLNLPE